MLGVVNQEMLLFVIHTNMCNSLWEWPLQGSTFRLVVARPSGSSWSLGMRSIVEFSQRATQKSDERHSWLCWTPVAMVLCASHGKDTRCLLTLHMPDLHTTHMHGLLLGWVKDLSLFGSPLTESMKSSCLFPSIGPNKWAIRPFGVTTDCIWNATNVNRS